MPAGIFLFCAKSVSICFIDKFSSISACKLLFFIVSLRKNLQVTIMKQLSFIHAHLRLALVCLLLGATTMLMAASRFVSFQSGDLQLTGGQITISYDVADAKAVAIAAQTLSQDFQRVTGSPAQLTQNDRGNILVGTLGQSALIDRLVKQHKLDASLLKGKREKFVITLIDNQLVIAGSDRRVLLFMASTNSPSKWVCRLGIIGQMYL